MKADVDVFYIILIVVAAHPQSSSDIGLRIRTVLDLEEKMKGD